MYNLTVDEAHTFYVGDGQWLVHNYCPIPGATKPVRVGRWMELSEYQRMVSSQKVQGGLADVTSISYPASPKSYTGTGPGTVYVEFDVPEGYLIEGGRSDWFRILGPNSGEAMRLLQAGRISELPDFPFVENIILVMRK